MTTVDRLFLLLFYEYYGNNTQFKYDQRLITLATSVCFLKRNDIAISLYSALQCRIHLNVDTFAFRGSWYLIANSLLLITK